MAAITATPRMMKSDALVKIFSPCSRRAQKYSRLPGAYSTAESTMNLMPPAYSRNAV